MKSWNIPVVVLVVVAAIAAVLYFGNSKKKRLGGFAGPECPCSKASKRVAADAKNNKNA